MSLPNYSSHQSPQDTIAAIATASGRGGIGIVRVSGPLSEQIAQHITQCTLTPRHAHFCSFVDGQQQHIDEGLALLFKAPHSFTGEDCLELQGHGGPVVLDLLLQECLKLGARLAQPGEFSQRAFLNDKIDLTQAEAIADLIDAASVQAARNALNTLQGVFSQHIHDLVEALTQLRMYVEAAIDFPEEDFSEEEQDFLSDDKIKNELINIIEKLQSILQRTQQGLIVREGLRVVIAGRPNAGKSSLLNALTEKDSAIVTDIEGTTRDVLREYIHIDGMPLHLIDTAGLRDNPDVVEKIGIEKAQREFEQADRILLIVDSSKESSKDPLQLWPHSNKEAIDVGNLTVVLNKIDLSGEACGLIQSHPIPVFGLSAKNNLGINKLKQHLQDIAGYQGSGEGSFTARRRHVEALQQALALLENGKRQLLDHHAGELLAEDLRLAQQALGEITGAVTPDDLLGRIFSSFCIGK